MHLLGAAVTGPEVIPDECFCPISAIGERSLSEISLAVPFGSSKGILTHFLGSCMYVGTFRAKLFELDMVAVTMWPKNMYSWVWWH